LDLATYNANKPPTSQVHKTLPGVPLDGAVVSGTPSLIGESMPVEKSKVVSGLTAMARRGVHIKCSAFLEAIGKLKGARCR
jgi:cation transport ATPase